MSIEHFNNLLKDLGKSVGLPDLKPGSQGLCSLRFDDRVTIDLECNEDSGALIFSSIVGTLAPHEAESFYPLLLEANLLWAGTGGATLGVDPATLSVFMCYQEKITGMEFLRFQELLKGFSDTALYWNQRLGEGPAGTAGTTSPKTKGAVSSNTTAATTAAPIGGTYA
ncbi:MAG: type III secretion system chaperone [Chthoniobacterales bacterium]